MASSLRQLLKDQNMKKTAALIGEDVDLLVILIGCTLSHEQEIFFEKSWQNVLQQKF